VGVHGVQDAKARQHVENLHALLKDPRRREGRILGLVASALSEYEECFEGHGLLTTLPREIVEAFEVRGSKWPWRDRVLALDALGRLPGGDPRLKGDPWVKFKAGRFTMGGDAKAFQSAPEHEARVGEFWLRRWPVTVSEYGEFVMAGGYAKQEFWDTEVGEAEPRWWPAQQRHPNRPVVGVSWFEARAFCRWANAAGWAPPGREVSLPTEEQWEYAARGAGRKSRRYAWGQQATGRGDMARASYYWDGDVPTAPTPVGAFTRGHTPEGVWDLTGNVWEWTACRFRQNAGEWRQGNVVCHQDQCVSGRHGNRRSMRVRFRAVRGGSWGHLGNLLYTAARGTLDPVLRNDDVGFRVVCVCSRQHA
jgi:formylglycine-generating enzyme required for sulfatase activity